MHAIQEWINNHLIEWGIISSSANELDNTIVLLLIIAVTVGIDYACRYIFLNMFKRLAKRTRNQWDDLIVERKIINKLMHMIPAILVYVLLPLAFPVDETPKILGILQMICKIYIIAVSLRFISASLNVVHEIYNRKESLKNKPLKGFIQLLQVAVFFIGFILIISILIGKSPTTLFAGLGASAAILMLVFKDTLLGFVAGIQLSANDMLRPGDWITMEKYGANGTVIEVTLNAVKVKNFDNTITTIPPYALVSDAFQNWRGMSESPGRRIKRSINIDMNSVSFCTPEMLAKFRKISLLTDYIDEKEKELNAYNEARRNDEFRRRADGIRQSGAPRYRRSVLFLSRRYSLSARRFCGIQANISGVQKLTLFISILMERLIRRPGDSDIPRQFWKASLAIGIRGNRRDRIVEVLDFDCVQRDFDNRPVRPIYFSIVIQSPGRSISLAEKLYAGYES